MWRAVPLLRPLGLAARNRFVLAGLGRPYGPFLPARPRLQRAAPRPGGAAAAFAAMWRAVPLLRPLGLAARNRFVLAGLERLYGLFLRVRPRLQRAARRLEARSAS